MDRVLKVHRSFLNEIRGFLNVFTQSCVGCFRRPCDCENYIIVNRAKRLIERIDVVRDAEEERYFVENPRDELFARIRRAIEQAGRPVRSEEIRIAGLYRQRKAWALRKMLKRGALVTVVVDGAKHYDLSNRNNTQTKGTR